MDTTAQRRGIPATSVPITDEVMIRYDRAERRVVGVQFAHFLSKVAREHPIFLSLLDIAELRDIIQSLAHLR